MAAAIPTLSLSHSGIQMPMLGLGTWQSPDEEVKRAVKSAVSLGYRHIDCAYGYGNEKAVGEALKELFDEGVVKREDLFIVSKLWNTRHRPDMVEPQLMESLDRLGLAYLDLWLMHYPFCYKTTTETNLPKDEDGNVIFDNIHYSDTWKAMEECCDKGLTKDIGVSNFNSEQVKTLVETGRIKPACNQVEAHPYFNQQKLADFCSALGVPLVAFSPLGCKERPWKFPGEENLVVFNDPVIKAIGDKYKKSPAQVSLRWLHQRKITVTPKSVNPERIKENMEIFDFSLSDEDMETINGLNTNNRLVVPALLIDGKKVLRDRKAPYYPFNIEF